jgi:hypothetical protein
MRRFTPVMKVACPRVHMELGHHHQRGVRVGQAHGLGHVDLHGVQIDGAVAVDHALGVAGGAGGVAHRGGRALVQLRPVVRRRLARDQLLVLVHPDRGPGQQGAVARAGDDDVLDRLQMRQQRGEEREQGAVGDHDPVGGVPHDPDELLRREAEVEGVEHGAHGGDGEVRLDVLGVVPHQGRHPLVAGDLEVRAQGVRQLGRAGADLREGAAVRFALTGPGGHL